MSSKAESKCDESAWTFTRSKYTLLAFVLRVALLFGALPQEISRWLDSRAVQSILIDPIYTLDHVQEAVAIRRLVSPQHAFADAYQGEQIYLPPLLLALVQPFLSAPNLVLGFCLIVVDFLIARHLEKIGRRVILNRDYSWEDNLVLKKMPSQILPALLHIFSATIDDNNNNNNTESPVFRMQQLPFLMAQIYFLSPIPLLCSSVLHCFQTLPVLCLTTATLSATQGSLVWSALFLAAAAYMNIHYTIFLIPLEILARERQRHGLSILFAILTVALQALSLLLVGQEKYLSIALLTHGRTFVLTGIDPSLSTLWYMGMEVFDRFSTYMTILLAGAPYLLLLPLFVRLHRYPETLIVIFWMLGTLFRPPGTLFALNLGLSLFLLAPRSCARLKSLPLLVALCGLIVPVVLYVVTMWLWLEPGSGEANFCFFQCLAYNIFVAILLVQFCSASLRRDKAMRLTEKQLAGGAGYRS